MTEQQEQPTKSRRGRPPKNPEMIMLLIQMLVMLEPIAKERKNKMMRSIGKTKKNIKLIIIKIGKKLKHNNLYIMTLLMNTENLKLDKQKTITTLIKPLIQMKMFLLKDACVRRSKVQKNLIK